MTRLLLRCYPVRWRARYGDEFASILHERPLGPFDVADVVLGAIDAHLHLRGLGAAFEHGRGFAMTLRIGGFAAIAGGVLWFLALAGAGTFGRDGDSSIWTMILVVATIAILGALVGLSAFQARRYPRLIWASFVVPAAGAVVAVVGLLAMAIVGDRPFVADMSPWTVWALGTLALMIGSALFALATWRTRTFSRRAAALLMVGAFAVVPALGLSIGGMMSEAASAILLLFMVAAFGAGWVWLGVSALQVDGYRFGRQPGATAS